MKFPHRGPLALAVFGLLCAPHSYGFQSAVELDAGFRRDSLRWSIAGDLSGKLTPNVLSELTWESINIRQLAVGWKADSPDGVQLRTKAAYGWIYDGRNRDSDYLGDDRTLEFSRSDNETSDDSVLDLSAAIGYRLDYRTGRMLWRITPLLGLSRHEQRLRITNGFQTVPPLGPFPNLDSTYRTKWTGPWAGIELSNESGAPSRGFIRLEHHWADFRAHANWNLREDFQHPRSFEHEANGRGSVVSVGIVSPVRDQWSVRLSIDYQRWRTDPGIDRVYFANGAVAVTRLNEVEWTSRALLFGIERPL